MADIRSLLSGPSFMDQAYNDAYSAEINNQLVQQKVRQLQEEAMRQAQMLPYELEGKKASTNFMNAQAEKMRREPQEINADRKAKAARIMEQDALLNDYVSLHRLKSKMPTSNVAFEFSNIYPTFSPRTQKLFGQGDKWSFTPELVDTAISTIEKMHPDLAKNVREETRGEYGLEKQRLANEARTRIAEAAANIKKLQSQGKDNPKTREALSALYSRMANEMRMSGDAQGADAYDILADQELAAAQSLKPLPQQEITLPDKNILQRPERGGMKVKPKEFNYVPGKGLVEIKE